MNNVVEKTKKHVLKLVDQKKITKRNKELIFGFIDKISAEGHRKGAYSPNRLKKYIYGLVSMSKRLGKDFDKATQQDINKLAAEIREVYKGETPRDYLVMLRIFMRYIKELDGEKFKDGEFPEIVEKIKPGPRQYPKIEKTSLLSIGDVKKLANHTQNLRDRAFVLALYEIGPRIGECIGDENYPGIRIRNVKFDKYGAIIDLDGKTGLRSLRIIASAPAISNWLQEHPDRNDPNAPLFCGIWTNRGGKVGYRYWYNLLQDIGEKAGFIKRDSEGKRIKIKPVNPHHFRHSRASELAKYMTEFQLNTYMGWVQGSKEAKTYVLLSGKDTEDTILAMHGIKTEKEEETEFKTIICPRCTIENDPAAKFCSGCSLGLDEKSVMKYDERQEKAKQLGNVDLDMLKDPEFREFYNETLGQAIKKYREIKGK